MSILNPIKLSHFQAFLIWWLSPFKGLYCKTSCLFRPDNLILPDFRRKQGPLITKIDCQAKHCLTAVPYCTVYFTPPPLNSSMPTPLFCVNSLDMLTLDKNSSCETATLHSTTWGGGEKDNRWPGPDGVAAGQTRLQVAVFSRVQLMNALNTHLQQKPAVQRGWIKRGSTISISRGGHPLFFP
jgi:hypothetical protein